MRLLGYSGWGGRGGTGRRTQRRPVKRFRRLAVPEPLEDWALPGGSLLELLLGAPLVSPFPGSSWADGNAFDAEELAALAARKKERLAAFAELRQDQFGVDRILGEMSGLLDIASADRGLGDLKPVANLPPLAANDSFFIAPGGTLTLPSPGVLGNDFDPEGAAPSVSLVSGPAHAQSFELRSDGSFIYQPQAGYQGPDQFVYRMTDGQDTDEGVVSMGVTGWNYPPYANPDTGYAPAGQTSSVFVLMNDFDMDGDYPLTVTAVGQPSKGTASVAPGGTAVQYTPNPGVISGTDTFTYTVADSKGASSTGNVTMKVFQVSGFTVELSPAKRREEVEISSIQWTTRATPDYGELDGSQSDHDRFFPDALTPGPPPRTKVDVLVRVGPARAGIPVAMKWFDVDDYDDNGPIDNTDPPPGMPKRLNEMDNFPTAGMSWPSLGAVPATDANGEVRAVFDVGWIQPGNNFRVAAGGRSEEVNLLKALSPDYGASLFWDLNNDDLLSAGEAVLSASNPAEGLWITRQLRVWRKLHMEVDSMGPVVGNLVRDTAGRVQDQHDGTSRVPVVTGGLEVNRFENGRLQDDEGYVFSIISNTADSVLVRNAVGGIIPTSYRAVWLYDDDAQVMPEMQDTGLMQQAYAAAFIAPIVDGGGYPANNKNNVPFQLNLEWENHVFLAQIQATNGLESDGNRSTAYWIAYVQSAYQPDTGHDQDPNSEHDYSGGTPSVAPKKGSLVFLETAKDVARYVGFNDPQVFVQRTVVHEVAHQFDVADGQGPRPSVMHDDQYNPNCAQGSQFNEDQCWTLRVREESPGA